MSSTNTDFPLTLRSAEALANNLFPKLDTALRSGRHLSADDFESYALLCEYQNELEQFYSRYHVELIKAPEGFFYLRPRPSSEIPTSILSELDMLLGKVLCYLYLSPERLANEGILTMSELLDELMTLADESALLRLVNNRAGGTDLDKKKLHEKLRTSMRRMKRLGMITTLGQGDKFRINESVFRFAADVRTDEDPQAVQLRLIQAGEAIAGATIDETDVNGEDDLDLLPMGEIFSEQEE